VQWAVCNLSVCRKVNRQYKHNLSYIVHNHRHLYQRITRPSTFHRELHKYLLEMPISPTLISTDTVRQHFIESCTENATIIDDSTNGYRPSAFHRELQTVTITDVYHDR
jgi:hypothetical protein